MSTRSESPGPRRVDSEMVVVEVEVNVGAEVDVGVKVGDAASKSQFSTSLSKLAEYAFCDMVLLLERVLVEKTI